MAEGPIVTGITGALGWSDAGGAGEGNYFGLLDDLVVKQEMLRQGQITLSAGGETLGCLTDLGRFNSQIPNLQHNPQQHEKNKNLNHSPWSGN